MGRGRGVRSNRNEGVGVAKGKVTKPVKGIRGMREEERIKGMGKA